jgi:hypothetical protein
MLSWLGSRRFEKEKQKTNKTLNNKGRSEQTKKIRMERKQETKFAMLR